MYVILYIGEILEVNMHFWKWKGSSPTASISNAYELNYCKSIAIVMYEHHVNRES